MDYSVQADAGFMCDKASVTGAVVRYILNPPTHCHMCRHHQTALESLSTWRWSLSSLYPYNRRDMDLFVWTWAKQTVRCGVTKDHHAHKKVDIRGSDEIHYGLRLQHILLTHAFHPGTTVKTVYRRNFLEYHFHPYCIARAHITWGQDLVCYMTMLTVTLPTQWFVPKMELGSSGTYTVLIEYEPMWQFLSESERTIVWHPLQDERRHHEGSKACDNIYQEGTLQMVSDNFHKCGRRLYLRSVNTQL
jgi:hypothetical protein